MPRPSIAQGDTTRVRPDSVSDSLPRPLTPRRAFLSSLVFPGYGQFRMGRASSGTLYAMIEIASLAMAGKAAVDLREAQRIGTDSVPSGFTVHPVTGEPQPTGYTYTRFTPERIRARRTHYEDWVVTVVFNHLISGIDAFIYANFWDFPGSSRTRVSADGVSRLKLSISW